MSVITVTWNSLDGLLLTNSSLPSKELVLSEFLLIDALSSDGTAEFVVSSDCSYDIIVSESDEGIYDAMNKAIALAKGEYLLFLNTGDRFHENLDWTIVAQRLTSERAVWVGDLAIDDGGFATISKDSFTLKFFLHHSLPHQAAFIPREYFQQIGAYNKAYRISADQEWFLRAIKIGLPFRSLGLVVARYAGGGVSEQPHNRKVLVTERSRMLQVTLGWWWYTGLFLMDQGRSALSAGKDLLIKILFRRTQ